MAEPIESFVSRLQADGVEAGRIAADKLRAAAESQARQTVERARAEADRIVADAKARAQRSLAAGKTELELAARDIGLRLRDSLNGALRAVLSRAAHEKLADLDFVGTVLHDVIQQYASADAEGKTQIEINVEPHIREKLVAWAIREIGQDGIEGPHKGVSLRGALADAGFEYTIDGATIEVTVTAVSQLLSDLVSPAVREIIRKAMVEKDPG
jgi:V/A-type H+-transporting ATPase subunit E